MANPVFTPVTGIIRTITPQPEQCCNQMISLLTESGPVTLLLTPETYVAGARPLRPRMRITAFYDANLPVPLIFPPQYTAILITPVSPGQNVAAGHFDENLLAEDGSLKLNIGRSTAILTANGQRFGCDPGGNLLLVYYGASTRSIPPQTTPDRIIVLC